MHLLLMSEIRSLLKLIYLPGYHITVNATQLKCID